MSKSFLDNIIKNDGVEPYVNTCRSGGCITTDLMTSKSRMGPRWITFLKLKDFVASRNISSNALMIMGNKFKARALALWKSHHARATARKETESRTRLFTVQKNIQKVFVEWKKLRDEIAAKIYTLAVSKMKFFKMAFDIWHQNMLNQLRISPWSKKHVTRIELEDADGSKNYLVMPSVYVPKGLKDVIDKGDPYKTFQFVFMQKESSS